ncbi:aminoethylphosphonate catabolism associated LysR family transcriptional regulator [Pseudonocardia ammonioxydans]|uniref:Aminoethylphosphonate catabolism associated LysR family transcriptional regulator n=2 Tax=Pseudonocardia ammonioxydans TaxID=260086 RepID=A0A1I4YDW2_PSUAM|nr:aminoethylphosphonate catabolism associated LysR family transcriptional regulator [Pseudonocardia ammonioxydans]
MVGRMPTGGTDEHGDGGRRETPGGLPYVSFNQLRSFHAVAVAGSVTAAAALLHVSQPTVTTQLRQLEAHYGIELVRRTPRGMVLSPLGEQLFGLTEQVFDLQSRIVDLLGSSATAVRGELRVGGVAPHYVMPALAAFTRAHPAVRVSLQLANSAAVVEGLVEQSLDVGVVGQTVLDSRLAAVPSSTQQVVIVCRDDHRWAGREGIELAELDGEPLVMREPGSTSRLVLEQALTRRGVVPYVSLEVNREGVREAVVAGFGVGISTEVEYVAEPRTRRLPIMDADISTEAFAVCLRGRRHGPAVRAFMATAERLFDENRPVRSPH